MGDEPRSIHSILDAAARASEAYGGPSLVERARALGGDFSARVLREICGRAPNAERLLHDWDLWSRPKQRPPPGDWDVWVLLAGRRFGKTRCGAEWVRRRVETGLARSIGIIGPTYPEVRRYMIGGYKRGGSGILDVSPPWFRPTWRKNDGELHWPNGAIAYAMTGEDAELRGYGLDTLWGDEPPLWRRGQELWANAELTMSDRNYGVHPQSLLTTTTRPTKLLREIITEEGTITTIGSSEENLANLSKAWWRKMSRKLVGTEWGEQELYARWIEGGRGVLWSLETIDQWRQTRPPPLRRVVVGVDPAGGGQDAIGIVAVGLGVEGDLWVLDDETRRDSPEAWGASVLTLVTRWNAEVVVERSKFGDLAAANIRAACRAAGRRVPRIVEVAPSDSKEGRAAPIAACYSRGQVHHVGRLARLEDEMVQWVPGRGRSPNGVDALCHAAHELLGLDLDRAPGDARKGLLAAAAVSWGAPSRTI